MLHNHFMHLPIIKNLFKIWLKNGSHVENLVENVQNFNKTEQIFNFSTLRGCGKVEKTLQFYSNVENGRCRKIKIFTFPLDKKMPKKG